MDTPAAVPAPVPSGNTFATLLREMLSLVHELEARRRFDAEVGEWLKEFGLVDEFEAWREKKREAGNTKAVPDAAAE